MKSILMGLFAGASTILFTMCSPKKADTPNIINKITELPKFKKAEGRVDSLQREGINVEIQVSILEKTFDPEDSRKGISLALIEENSGVDQKLLYKIKFNRKTLEIISIEPNF